MKTLTLKHGSVNESFSYERGSFSVSFLKPVPLLHCRYVLYIKVGEVEVLDRAQGLRTIQFYVNWEMMMPLKKKFSCLLWSNLMTCTSIDAFLFLVTLCLQADPFLISAALKEPLC